MKPTCTTFIYLILVLILGACKPQTSPENETEASSKVVTTLTQAIPTATTPASALPSSTPTPTQSPTIILTSTPTLPPTSKSPTETIITSAPPSLTPSPTPLACWQEGGIIEQAQIDSAFLPKSLEFRVYTPPCYDQQPERRYPVLYLIHGQSFNDDQWERMGVDEIANALIAAGEISPFIIVMPRDRVWSSPEEDMFGEAVIHDLLPRIDQTYRTIPERTHRVIGGLSRGASWAVHLGILNWEYFSAVGAHSLPVFPSDTNNIRKWLAAIPRDSIPRFFIDIAELDRWSVTAAWFENILTEMDIPHVWHFYTGYHNEDYWQTHLEEYLRWYARDW